MDPLLGDSNSNETPKIFVTRSDPAINDSNHHDIILSSARSAHSLVSNAGVSDSNYVAMDQGHHLSLDGINDRNQTIEEYKRRDPEDEETGTFDERTITGTDGAMFDDLEFLHDFLEHESKKPFFESNFFKLNCKNISKVILFFIVVGVILYILYYEYGNFFTLEFFKLASIPIICILFTYGHIAMALWMTFWPTHFWPHSALQFKSGPFKGYGLGWQGIVPMKAVKMAQICVDLMVPDVVRMEDVVSKIDPSKVSEIVEPALLEILKILIPRVAAKQGCFFNKWGFIY